MLMNHELDDNNYADKLLGGYVYVDRCIPLGIALWWADDTKFASNSYFLETFYSSPFSLGG